MAVCTVVSGVSLGLDLPKPVDPATVPESDYVTISPEGYLQTGGKRVRFWGVIGAIPNGTSAPKGKTETDEERSTRIIKAHHENELIAQRLDDLGFNLVRFWRPSWGEYTAGDGSSNDTKDFFLWQLKKRGFRIWIPGMAQTYPYAKDVDIIHEPETAEAWAAAMKEMENNKDNLARVVSKWDPRTEAVMIRGLREITDHYNHYTGFRVGDDPLYAAFEMTNEDWWISKMVGGMFHKLPPYFQRTLQGKWTAYLSGKYGSDEALSRKWGGLLPGESIALGTVGILPLRGAQKPNLGFMDVQAEKNLKDAAADSDTPYSRDDFNVHRGADVLEFFCSLHVAHYKRLEAALETMGKACKLVPTVLDTGIGYEIQSAWLHQNADVSVHDAYINGTPRNNDPAFNRRYPWMSGLEEYPRICHDVPWMEHNKMAGQPFMVYETQIQQPAKFRAEFPWRVLALASIQDWDAICWHYWGSVNDIGDSERPFDKAMDYTIGRHPQGYHFTYDEVQASAMRAAAYAFREGAYKPAPTPTVFTYGRRSLYDPDSMDYAGSYGKMGLNMLPTTYRYGVRLHIDPTRENDEVVGPIVRQDAESKPDVIRPTDEICFDTRRGGVSFDSPKGAAFAGFMSHFGETITFPVAGVELSNVKVYVPPNMPYPDDLEEEKYLAFGLVAEDGKPLKETRRAMLSLVCTSFNSGFVHSFDREGRDLHDGKALPGKWPVITARVSGTVKAPSLSGMRFAFLDWHMNEIDTGVMGSDGVLHVPSDKPIWFVQFERYDSIFETRRL